MGVVVVGVGDLSWWWGLPGQRHCQATHAAGGQHARTLLAGQRSEAKRRPRQRNGGGSGTTVRRFEGPLRCARSRRGLPSACGGGFLWVMEVGGLETRRDWTGRQTTGGGGECPAPWGAGGIAFAEAKMHLGHFSSRNLGFQDRPSFAFSLYPPLFTSDPRGWTTNPIHAHIPAQPAWATVPLQSGTERETA